MSNKFSPNLVSAPADKIFYTLTMFPYPSGVGLHAGHASVFTINDVVARVKRMQGYTVFNPFGFDAFGLPTENYALQQHKGAREVTDINKQMFLDQVKALDISFDYDRVIDTSMPDYYKWTQWIFTQLMEAGLVYRDEKFVNRCPVDMTVLANDQVVDGKCERCKSEIVQKKHMQWFIKITDYADRLIADLDTIDWPEETKIMQKNWIGRSEGAEIDFKVTVSSGVEQSEVEGSPTITVFTTRPDTLYGVTAVVLAPENTLLDHLLSPEKVQEIQNYRNISLAKTAVQRQQDAVEKTGIFSGLYAIHPLTGEQVPVWFADYVLMDYGSGAVMMVPAHDERDREFAKKFDIPVKQVIAPKLGSELQDPIHPKQSAYGIIFNKEKSKILVLKPLNTDTTSYSFPGGTVEEGENLEIALQREIYEETGLKDFEIKSTPYGIQCNYFIKKKGNIENFWRENNSYTFVGLAHTETLDEASLTEEEIDLGGFEALWIDINEFEKYIQDIEKQYNTNPGSIFPSELLTVHSYNYFKNPSAYTGSGIMINSDKFDGMDSTIAKSAIIAYLEELGVGRKKITYRLRDRSVSRQRYRGSPIPVYYDHDGNPQLIPESDLPVVLPLDVTDFKPKGKSPLEDHPTFKYYEKDGETYLRECDTLDTFMCSSFYFLRYPDAHNNDALIRKDLADKMFSVDLYTGGKEHTVGHLLYSRFIHKFLYDQGYVSSPEPFKKLIHQGMVLGADGRKMGKRYNNGVDPLEIIDQYGTDAVRTYLMFMGPIELDKVRNDGALNGTKKFLDRVYKIPDQTRFGTSNEDVTATIHETIKTVSDDVEHYKFNTAISKIMIAINTIYDKQAVTVDELALIAQLLAPFAPATAQYLWEKTGNQGNINFSSRPVSDESKITLKAINFPIQINGKMRGTLTVPAGISEQELLALVHTDETISKYLTGTTKKVIFVADKIMNIING